MNRVYLKIDGSVTSARDLPERLNEPPCSPGRRVRKRAKGKRDEGTSGLPIKFSAPCPVNTIRFRRDWNTKNGAADVRSVIPCKLFYFWIFFFFLEFSSIRYDDFPFVFSSFFLCKMVHVKMVERWMVKIVFFLFFSIFWYVPAICSGGSSSACEQRKMKFDISEYISGINKRERRF